MKLILLSIVITVACCISLMLHIEKHSVHPIYGNYKHFDSAGHSCEPWDSCKDVLELKQSQSPCHPEVRKVNWCWPWDSCYIIEDVCKEKGKK